MWPDLSGSVSLIAKKRKGNGKDLSKGNAREREKERQKRIQAKIAVGISIIFKLLKSNLRTEKANLDSEKRQIWFCLYTAGQKMFPPTIRHVFSLPGNKK